MSAAAKATIAEAEALQARAEALQASVAEIQDQTAALEREMSMLRANEPELRRSVAEARLRQLMGMAQARQQLLSAGGISEDEATALKAEIDADMVEAQQLAQAWGLSIGTPAAAPVQQQQPQSAQPQSVHLFAPSALSSVGGVSAPDDASEEVALTKANELGVMLSTTNVSTTGSEAPDSELPGSSLPDDSRSQYAASMSQYAASPRLGGHNEQLSPIASRRVSDAGVSPIGATIYVRSPGKDSLSPEDLCLAASTGASELPAASQVASGLVAAAPAPAHTSTSDDHGAAALIDIGGESAAVGATADGASPDAGGDAGVWMTNDLYDGEVPGDTGTALDAEEGSGGLFDGLDVAGGGGAADDDVGPLPVRTDMPLI